MGYNLLINGVYWGYKTPTKPLLTSSRVPTWLLTSCAQKYFLSNFDICKIHTATCTKASSFPPALHPRSTVMLKRYPWFFHDSVHFLLCKDSNVLSKHLEFIFPPLNQWCRDERKRSHVYPSILLNLYANTRLANVRSRRSCDWALRRRHPQVFLWKHPSLELNRFKNHDVFYLLTIKIIKHVSNTLLFHKINSWEIQTISTFHPISKIICMVIQSALLGMVKWPF